MTRFACPHSSAAGFDCEAANATCPRSGSWKIWFSQFDARRVHFSSDQRWFPVRLSLPNLDPGLIINSFYYIDERTDDNKTPGAVINLEAHADIIEKLIGQKEQSHWQVVFHKDGQIQAQGSF